MWDLRGNVDFGALPWSPDDSRFLYYINNTLVVFPVDTNKAPVPVDIGTTKASSVIWVNPSEFAWLEGETICYAEEQADGHWEIRRYPIPGRVSSLTAVDDHTVAWCRRISSVGSTCRKT